MSKAKFTPGPLRSILFSIDDLDIHPFEWVSSLLSEYKELREASGIAHPDPDAESMVCFEVQQFVDMAQKAKDWKDPAPALYEALEEALSVIQDYLDYKHDGDPWIEDSRSMGEMEANEYGRDGRLEKAEQALAQARGEQPKTETP